MIVNTHVHMPPNFSAYTCVGDAVATAAAEGVRALGISNFYDWGVYHYFGAAADAAGIYPLFGLEFIAYDASLAQSGVRVNDPANPGRFYLCGKGADMSRPLPETAHAIRSGNDSRVLAMVQLVRDRLLMAGVPGAAELTVEGLSAKIAERSGTQVEWVSLQERHIAMGTQELLAKLPHPDRVAAFERLYGRNPDHVDDAVAVQSEIRARLLKAGTPAFVPEVLLRFEEAYELVLAMGAVPVYPTLADGATPVCEFEDPADELAGKVLARGIYAAEIIPVRNRSVVVDEYVRAFTQAGIVVMAGTEHNTADRLPLDPACVDGPVSEFAREAFWQGTCVVAAHQWLSSCGDTGFVDSRGARTDATVTELAALGASLIEGRSA